MIQFMCRSSSGAIIGKLDISNIRIQPVNSIMVHVQRHDNS